MSEADREGVAEVVRENGRTSVILPEGWELEFALYRIRRQGRALILEPAEAGGPVKKGRTPTKVQGGYVPTASSTRAKPPYGGSGAKR